MPSEIDFVSLHLVGTGDLRRRWRSVFWLGALLVAWLLLHGVINLLLGVMIWQQWPMSGKMIIGLFLGLDLFFNGLSLMMLGLTAKKLHHD